MALISVINVYYTALLNAVERSVHSYHTFRMIGIDLI